MQPSCSNPKAALKKKMVRPDGARETAKRLAGGKKWDGPLGFPHDRYSIVWTTAKG